MIAFKLANSGLTELSSIVTPRRLHCRYRTDVQNPHDAEEMTLSKYDFPLNSQMNGGSSHAHGMRDILIPRDGGYVMADDASVFPIRFPDLQEGAAAFKATLAFMK
jgi:hypothetical protein